jgi:hypothetical protein
VDGEEGDGRTEQEGGGQLCGARPGGASGQGQGRGRRRCRYRLVNEVSRRRLRFWHSYDWPLCVFGGLMVEANDLFGRNGNMLKRVGDVHEGSSWRWLAREPAHYTVSGSA